MDSLPIEITKYILDFCDPVVCAFVCRKWRDVAWKRNPKWHEWCNNLVKNRQFEILEWALSQGAIYVGCWCVASGVWSNQLICFLMQYKITPDRIQKVLYMTINVDFAFIMQKAITNGHLGMLQWLDMCGKLQGCKSKMLYHATKMDRPDIIHWYHYERRRRGFRKHNLRSAIKDGKINIVKWAVDTFEWSQHFWQKMIIWADQCGKNEIASYLRMIYPE
jgi:hypothetical protein